MSYFYRLFGYIVESEFEIVQASQLITSRSENLRSETDDRMVPDIRMIRAELTDEDINKWYDHYEDRTRLFRANGVGIFRVTDGKLIEVKQLCEDASRLSIFLTGSCMGAVFHQRDRFVLHGSVVSNGSRTILFTGQSGAGKSTLAAQFCKNGWKMLTDDVSLIEDPERERLVVPSYPSQKLWQDSLDRFYGDKNRIHSLYNRNDSVKYGVKADDFFCGEKRTLTDVVMIRPGGEKLLLQPMEGLSKIRLLMDNTYRPQYLLHQNLQKHFQRCTTMSLKLNMAVLNRPDRTDPQEVYDAVTEWTQF